MDSAPSAASVPPERTLGRGSAVGIAVAALVGGVSGYVVLVLAAQALDKPANASFLVFWAVLFGIYGAMGGIQTETVRAASALADAAKRTVDPSVVRDSGARILPTALGIGVVVAALAAATSPLWAPHLLGDAWRPQLGWLALGVVTFAVHVASTGVLGGRGAWNSYAALVGAEATVRLGLSIVAVVAASTVVGFSAAAAAASATWILFLVVSPATRSAWVARSDVATLQFLRRIGHASAAASASALLVVGFPVLLRLTSTDFEYAGAAPLILAITLTRGPLLLPLGAYQGVAIAHVVANREAGVRALLPTIRLLLVVGAIGTVLAAALGPAVLELVRHDYDVSAQVFAALLVGATVIALVTLTGAACLALDKHRAYSAGWIVATAVTIAILCAPFDINVRTTAALIGGPLLGVALHLRALRQG